MTEATSPRFDRLVVRDIDLEVVRCGAGPLVVFLHGFHTLDPDSAFFARLARGASVLAPSHPGFGGSPRPDDFDTVYDLVHLYRALLDGLPRLLRIALGLPCGWPRSGCVACDNSPRGLRIRWSIRGRLGFRAASRLANIESMCERRFDPKRNRTYEVPRLGTTDMALLRHLRE